MSNEDKSVQKTIINWYPGHMSKAKRMMQEDIKLIDVVIELLDARIPYSSRNPDIDNLAKNKSRVIILNKADMADKNVTAMWKSYYESLGILVCTTNSKSGNGIKAVNDIIKSGKIRREDVHIISKLNPKIIQQKLSIVIRD